MDENLYFKVADGSIIKAIEELPFSLAKMSEETFRTHVNEAKNDFANWLRDVFKLYELAYFIGRTRDKKEIISLLKEKIKPKCKILVINAGSSSLKYELFNMENETVLIKGIVDAINLDRCVLKFTINGNEQVKQCSAKNHEDALKTALNSIIENKIIENLNEITAIGHRVVHGKDNNKTIILNDDTIKQIESFNNLAPLHNPHNLEGIYSCKKILPDKPNVAVFDTAFHANIPKEASFYALPYDLSINEKIKKYGFHGTSHKYLSQSAIEILKKQGKGHSRIITCHLGNGSSITAIKDGVSIDTSMGFTPLEGIPMGTRSGSIDPGIIFYLLDKMKPEELHEMLEKKSGFVGIAGTQDMRDLRENSLKGNEKAQLAMDVFCYKIAFYISGYASALNGIDAVVFSAGIGENCFYIRKKVCDYQKHFGIELDETRNEKNETIISKPSSKIAVLVIPTNEELQIARETLEVIG
jgi:acetate kinase